MRDTPLETQTVTTPTRLSLEETFQDAVLNGLTAIPKRLPSKYFYDELGSQLFEAICLLPEYYLTRAETQILETNAAEIASRLGPDHRLVELGAGSAIKTRILIRAMRDRQATLRYTPIDISEEAMRIAQANIRSEFPECLVEGIIGDWIGSLARMRETDPHDRLILFLGSSIGNLDVSEAISFLGAIRDRMGPADRLLLGTDLAKDPRALIQAYDDAIGVTAAFNRNLLVRINRELGGHFDPALFSHEARWNEEACRIEMHLVATMEQEVRVDALDRSFHFDARESIHTENAHKYAPRLLATMLDRAGLVAEQTWTDPDERFALHLIAPAGER